MKEDTILVTAGRGPNRHQGVVNPPVYRASTVLFPSVAALENRDKLPPKSLKYGRYGTPTTFALAEAITTLEGGHDTWIFSSGMAALAVALLAYVRAGDHVLMVDSVYGPTRRFCDNELQKMGIETTYYDPLIGADIADLIRPETRVVFVESPGSLTFEVQDIPAISSMAKANGATVIMDNTWASPLFFKALSKGVDVSVQAATKYIAGHSDIMLGAVTTTEGAWPALEAAAINFGQCASPDDCYLALRGLRTLGARMRRHQETAMVLAQWFQERPEVDHILHPALPNAPGHKIWQRDFSGASGLFGLVLHPCSAEALAAMLDGLELFGMGYSWGGYESLMLPIHPAKVRTATAWTHPGPTLRVHAGLEDPDDLIADLEAGFARLRATS